jgi:hypothetical protein
MATAAVNRLLPDLGARIWLLVLVNCLANTGNGLVLPSSSSICTTRVVSLSIAPVCCSP